MRVIDLGRLDYRSAWAEQERVHAEVLGGAEEAVLLVEHPPVITFGRRAETSASHLVASAELLRERGVEVVESDRGGDITFHGPGQLVVYPIVRLADHRLSVGGYVRRLQEAVIAALGRMGVKGQTDENAIGVWVGPAKICALGVRIKRGITLHGIALNVSTDLSFFDLIVPCGLSGRGVTSLVRELGPAAPTMAEARTVVTEALLDALIGNAGD